MAEAIFESYNELGRVMVSTRYPLLALQQTTSVTTVSDGFNAKGYVSIPVIPVNDGPITFIRPKSLGAYHTATGYVSTSGESSPEPTTHINAISLRTLSWDWNPLAGTFDVSLFKQTMIDSNSGFGLQTFNENGVLLYDSQTPAMGVHSIAKDNNWTLDKVVNRAGGGGGYKLYYYSTLFPPDADGARAIRNFQFTTTSEFGGGTTYYGCESSLDRYTAIITVRNDYPTTPTAPPWVMFVKKTIR